MRKFGKALVASLMASALAVTPVFAEPSVSDLENSKNAAQSEVSSLQSELQTLLEKINQLESDLIEKGKEIGQAEEDLSAAEEKEKQQYEAMKLRIKFMYEGGETGMLETLLTADNFSDLLNKAEYVQNVHTYDRKMLEEYVATKQEIADLKTTLETEAANMEQMQTEYAAEETSLNDTLATKQAEVADLDAQLQAAAEAAAQKQAEEARALEAAAIDEGGGTPAGNGTKNDTAGTGNNNNNDNNYTGGGNSSAASIIVSTAGSYLGVPYVYGGASYSGIDCSGLVMRAHQAAGISLSHSSGAIGGGGRSVSAAEALPGDVVCYAGHVGIYVGGGQMIHAPTPGQSVCYTNINYASHWFRRYW